MLGTRDSAFCSPAGPRPGPSRVCSRAAGGSWRGPAALPQLGPAVTQTFQASGKPQPRLQLCPPLGSASTSPSSRSACAGHGLGPGRRWKPHLWSHLGRGRRLPWSPVGTDGAHDSSCEGNLRPPRSWLFNKTKGSRTPSCLCQHFHPLPFTGSRPHGKLGDTGPAEASPCRAGARRGGPRPSVLQSGCVGRCTCM